MNNIDAIDDFDVKILNALQLNARLSNLDLSQQISLSTAATLERVKKLEQKKIINGYFTSINLKKINFNSELILHISIADVKKENIAFFIKKINSIPNVLKCYKVFGNNLDFILHIASVDLISYQENIVPKLLQMESIKITFSCIITENIKFNCLPM
jgi:Lrp/AsnC family leucine-responsive transcriptional regulator